jgi:RNA-directed DNA polymerase
MIDVARSNSPGGLASAAPAETVRLEAVGGDVRELQRKLWVAAKRSPGRRFHALFDRI